MGPSATQFFFQVTGGDYTRVCGTIKAYQYDETEGFAAYNDRKVTTIDGAYMDGISLTHGSPRQHIWTFASGLAEVNQDYQSPRHYDCPCETEERNNTDIPPFVGDDYFCESGNLGNYDGFHPDDPLWDGEGCRTHSKCCSFNNPPYFIKQLPYPTRDDIEVRLCQQDSLGDTPIEFIELYVQ